MRFASSIFATLQDIPETIVSYVGQIVFVKAMLYFVFLPGQICFPFKSIAFCKASVLVYSVRSVFGKD